MKKKANLLINGCSRGIGYDLFNALKLKYNVFGLSSIKSKKKNVFYYNPIINPRLDNNLLKIIKSLEIDHVIHCSGGGLKYYDKFLELNKLLDLFNINFFSIYEINKELIKNKKKQKKLNIIMIGSAAIFETRASIGYSAAKSILVNYNKNLALNFINEKIISKLLVPGSFISTKGSMIRLKQNNKKIFTKLANLIPSKKMMNSKEVVRFIEILMLKESDLLNGSYIPISNLESKSIFL